MTAIENAKRIAEYIEIVKKHGSNSIPALKFRWNHRKNIILIGLISVFHKIKRILT